MPDARDVPDEADAADEAETPETLDLQESQHLASAPAAQDHEATPATSDASAASAASDAESAAGALGGRATCGEPVGTRRRAAGAAARPVAGDPELAFDRLHRRHAGPLTRQAFLLCGDLRDAERAVAQGFRIVWEHWPEVSVDPDPPGWVRAAVHSCALSPWRDALSRVRRRRAPGPVSDAADRELLAALFTLPPAHRRCLLLHDGLGLGVPETAAETEATSAATAARLAHAREVLADRLPAAVGAVRHPSSEGAVSRAFLERCGDLPLTRPLPAAVIRTRSRQRARLQLWGTLAMLAALTAAALLTALPG